MQKQSKQQAPTKKTKPDKKTKRNRYYTIANVKFKIGERKEIEK